MLIVEDVNLFSNSTCHLTGVETFSYSWISLGVNRLVLEQTQCKMSAVLYVWHWGAALVNRLTDPCDNNMIISLLEWCAFQTIQ